MKSLFLVLALMSFISIPAFANTAFYRRAGQPTLLDIMKLTASRQANHATFFYAPELLNVDVEEIESNHFRGSARNDMNVKQTFDIQLSDDVMNLTVRDRNGGYSEQATRIYPDVKKCASLCIGDIVNAPINHTMTSQAQVIAHLFFDGSGRAVGYTSNTLESVEKISDFMPKLSAADTKDKCHKGICIGESVQEIFENMNLLALFQIETRDARVVGWSKDGVIVKSSEGLEAAEMVLSKLKPVDVSRTLDKSCSDYSPNELEQVSTAMETSVQASCMKSGLADECFATHKIREGVSCTVTVHIDAVVETPVK